MTQGNLWLLGIFNRLTFDATMGVVREVSRVYDCCKSLTSEMLVSLVSDSIIEIEIKSSKDF